MTAPETQNYFSLFQLPAVYALDVEDLRQRYQKMIALAHPDNFPLALKAEKQWAADYSACLNQAYAVLSCPVLRANYILIHKGLDPDLETDTHMSPEFLMTQMDLQELMHEAKNTKNEENIEKNNKIKKIEEIIQSELAKRIQAFTLCIDQSIDQSIDKNIDEINNIHQARTLAREMNFLKKLAPHTAPFGGER